MSRSILVALAVGCLGAVAFPQAQERAFPNTKRLGKAIARYKDPGLEVLVSYEYSQGHHDSPWLLIDFGARAERRLVLDREHFTLVSQSGEWYPVASQRHFIESSREVTSLRQNASIVRHDLGAYLGPRDLRESLKFFALPGEGIVVTGALLDKDRITLGEIYFETPRGAWEPGEYSLMIEHPRAKVALPIALR